MPFLSTPADAVPRPSSETQKAPASLSRRISVRRSPASPTWRAAETRALTLDSRSTRRSQAAHHHGAVHDGVRVRHHDDAGEAACCGCCRAALYGSLRLRVQACASGRARPRSRGRGAGRRRRARAYRAGLSPNSEILPDERRTSVMPSRPVDGSRTWAWRMTRSVETPSFRRSRGGPLDRARRRGRGRRSGRRRRRRPGRGSGRKSRGRRRRRSRHPC